MHFTCRTCMQIDQNHNNIFEYCGTSKMMSEMLLECTSIKVQENDGLPVNICNSCLTKLSSAWNFRLLAIETDSKLKNIFNRDIKENIQDGNTDIIVKEEPVIHSEVAALSETSVSVNKNSMVEKYRVDHDSNCTDFIQNRNQENIDSVLRNVNNSTLNDILKGFIKEENIPEENEEFKSLETVDKIPLTNINQDLISNSLNSVDYCDETKLVNKNTNGNCKSDVTDIQENREVETEVECNIVNDIENTNKSVVDKDTNKILCEDNSNQYLCSLSIGKVESSDKDRMKIQIFSKERIKELSSKEKEQLLIFCRICNRPFKYRYYFGMHIQLHNGDRHRKCDICGKAFVRQWQLQIHMAVHSELRPFSCKICGKTFKTKSCLGNHKSVHSDNTYSCSICQKTFKSKSLHTFHLKKHKNEKIYSCEICGKTFSDPNSIYSHRYTHAEEKNLPCPTCGKTYINKLSLHRHLKSHMGLRPYPCTYCDKKFKRKSARDEHISIHTGEKPLSCKICGKTFRHSAALYNHARIHNREAQYSCNLCPSQFKYSRHLQNHMKLHE